MLTFSDARVMLPVSAVAMKYSIWRNVYRTGVINPHAQALADRDHTLASGRYHSQSVIAQIRRSPGTPKPGAAEGFLARLT